MFEFSEEAFDQVTVSVKEDAEGKAFAATTLRRDVGEAKMGLDACANGIAVVSFVGFDRSGGICRQERRILPARLPLPGDVHDLDQPQQVSDGRIAFAVARMPRNQPFGHIGGDCRAA